MMIATAILAAVLSVEVQRRRAEFFAWKVRRHARMERSRVIAVVEAGRSAGGPELASLNAVRREYHAAMRHKYERAAATPWWPMAPDPPEPFEFSRDGRRVDVHFDPVD